MYLCPGNEVSSQVVQEGPRNYWGEQAIRGNVVASSPSLYFVLPGAQGEGVRDHWTGQGNVWRWWWGFLRMRRIVCVNSTDLFIWPTFTYNCELQWQQQLYIGEEGREEGTVLLLQIQKESRKILTGIRQPCSGYNLGRVQDQHM